MNQDIETGVFVRVKCMFVKQAATKGGSRLKKKTRKKLFNFIQSINFQI